MESLKGANEDLPALLARIEDLRMLLDLEGRRLSGNRLDVRRTIILQSLREFYPGSARRFRDELFMRETDDERLIIFALEYEDRDDVQTGRSGDARTCSKDFEVTDRHGRDDSNDDLRI
ncbi:hypothetical protein LCGC14_0228010 [marine sediment metagenome]|uniref:Uncharacterized protein n=1 Tax=marine sediment metagenome TaxID=412755 RepID=A0A0F9USH9_9ZZZZ